MGPRPSFTVLLFVLAHATPAPARPALILDPDDRMVFHHQPRAAAAASDRPAGSFDALHHDITLTVDPAAETIDGTTTLRVQCLADTDTLTVDLVGLEVSRVTVDGAEVAFDQSATTVSIEGDFDAGVVMDLGITYGGTPVLLDGTYQIDVGIEQRQDWGLWDISVPIHFHGEEAPIDLALNQQHQVFSFCRDEAVTSYDVDADLEVLKALNIIPIGNWEFTEECGPALGDDDDDVSGDDDDGGPYIGDGGEGCECSAGDSPEPEASLLLALLLGWSLRRR